MVDLVPHPIAPAMDRVIVLRAHHKAHLPAHPLRTKHHRVHQLRTQLQVAAVDTRVAVNLMVAVVVVDMTAAGSTNPQPLNQAAC